MEVPKGLSTQYSSMCDNMGSHTRKYWQKIVICGKNFPRILQNPKFSIEKAFLLFFEQWIAGIILTLQGELNEVVS